jgi:hypothetical protein
MVPGCCTSDHFTSGTRLLYAAPAWFSSEVILLVGPLRKRALFSTSDILSQVL